MAKSNFSGAGFGDELSPGVRVGGARYILKRLLGRGEVSEVWLSQDVKNSREVALKFLPQAFLSDTNLLEHFKEETQRNFLLKHPHIAATYEFVRDYSCAAIAAEFVGGWSLAAFKIDKPQQRYRVEEISPWVRQICDALKFAHEEFGIVHGDLKPSNLLLNAQEEIKITDFGIARDIRNESSRRGILKGISSGIGFLSPQQVMGGEPSKTDDIYSLGATIFDLLTGAPPFYKGEIVAQISGLKPPTISERLRELEIKDEIPPVWEDTVARCLAKIPAERPQSLGEILQLLDRKEVPKAAETKSPAPTIKTPPPVEIQKTKTAPPGIESPEIPPLIETQPPIIATRKKSKVPLAIGIAAAFAVLIFAAGIFAVVKLKHAVSSAVTKITDDIETNSPAPLAKPGTPGSLDATFNIESGADNEVRAIAIQADGKILIGGRLRFAGAPQKDVMRLNPDGKSDETFAHQASGSVYAIVPENNGDIFVAGNSMVEKRPRQHIALLTATGDLDKSFGFIAKFNNEVLTMAVQPDGKVLVGGAFTLISDKPQNRILRLNTDGSLDADFNANASASANVCALALQPDGKILVAGSFTNFNGADAGRLARLNADGTLDSSFNAQADSTVSAMAIQSDGSILIAGDFSSVNHISCHHIARLNRDGTVDTTFAAGSGANATIRAIAIQHDGKILIGGFFMNFDGVACNRIARLNADGSLDKTFNTGTGASDVVDSIGVQPDGKILVSGNFKSFDGNGCDGFVRLNN